MTESNWLCESIIVYGIVLGITLCRLHCVGYYIDSLHGRLPRETD